ncbi:MAG: hypothetical protein R2911_34840 [Caldilineaceae bacterium]
MVQRIACGKTPDGGPIQLERYLRRSARLFGRGPVHDRELRAASWRDERIVLRIGSANYAAKVWVNGTPVGEHEGGHLPFEFDVTDHIRWDAPNVIAIRVENHLHPNRVPAGNAEGGLAMFMRNFPSTTYDFFPYCGLHRAVSLYSTPPIHIEDITVTTAIDGAAGVVTVDVAAAGAAAGSIHLGNGETNWGDLLQFADGRARAQITVDDARFWSPDDPFLYKLTVFWMWMAFPMITTASTWASAPWPWRVIKFCSTGGPSS